MKFKKFKKFLGKPMCFVLYCIVLRSIGKGANRRPLADYSGTPYAVPTYYEDEVKELANLKVPIHCFYLRNGSKSAFNWMSNKTGGVSSELDINSSNGAKVLTDLVTTKVFCGGRSAAVQTKLLNSYQQKYGYCGHILPSN